MKGTLPTGKLPPDLLTTLLTLTTRHDESVVLGPGIGLDCAIVKFGEGLLAIKSDPITFASEQIGWYAVQVNANDIATVGATPRWFMVTLLLPEGQTTSDLVEGIARQVYQACQEIGVTVIGGHTEITYRLERPILSGTMIGEVTRDQLITPRGANPGDRILLTKGVPIEATAILARELPDQLEKVLTTGQLRQARDFLFDPGISVLREARLAQRAGRVTAMHDPTEGGVASALWELAEASRRKLVVDASAIPVPPLAARICATLGLDPLAAIASGALLLTIAADDAQPILRVLEAEGIPCAEIGAVEAGPPSVWQTTPAGITPLLRPERDEIARLFEALA